MKKFLAIFRENWGLKLLALVLAIVIYYSVRDSIHAAPGTSTLPSMISPAPNLTAPAPTTAPAPVPASTKKGPAS